MYRFSAKIEIIGVNPFVFVPDEILHQIFKQAGKVKGTIPITGTINNSPYKQTLVKYSGEWRLYINTTMLKNSPKRIGETIEITVRFDPESREIKPPANFVKALNENQSAKTVFDNLPPSRRLEIVRYLANLKTEETREKNIKKAIDFLLGKARFVGRDPQTKATFFAKQTDFRKWLKKNHTKETELLVGFYKVGSGKPSITWPQSVDEALCFGWIDGVRTSIDKDSYQIRFTQRKSTSIWSAINIKKVEELTKQGLMHAAGLASFEKRTENKSRIYSHEKEEVELREDFKKQFKANKKAWDYFQSLAPSYRKLSTHWIMGAKQEITRINRLNKIISDSAAGTNQWKDNKYK